MKSSFLTLFSLTVSLHAQGPLTPSGPPGPTMKSLQQIWDKIGGLETQNTTLQATVASQQQTLNQQSLLIEAIGAANGLSFPWQISTIQSNLPSGIDAPSLAFAPDGTPTVAFHGGNLHFAKLVGTQWQITEVEPAGAVDVGAFCSLKYSPTTGQPSIAYYDATNGDLKYAAYTGTTWAISIVESVGDVGKGCCLAFSQQGVPSIGYFDLTRNEVRCARFEVGNWQVGTVHCAPSAALPSYGYQSFEAVSISVGRDGREGILFNYNSDIPQPNIAARQILYYAQRSASGWPVTQVADDNPIGFHDLALLYDESYNSRCSYFSQDGQAFYKDPSTASDVIAPRFNVYGVQAALDGLGRPSFAIWDANGVRYCIATGSLTTVKSTSGGLYTNRPKIAFDSAGRVGVAYVDGSSLYFASQKAFLH